MNKNPYLNVKRRFFSFKYIMYHTISISSLSKGQLAKLLKGKPVRVKVGSSHKINVSAEQKKKLASAHKKGKASTLTFDPYQVQMHGKGMWDWADPNKNGVADAFKPVTEPIRETFTPDLGRDIAKEAIYKGLPIVGSTLGGIAGAELGPVGSMAGAYAGGEAGRMTANKIGELSGLGVRRRGRPKKGGALYVAGMKGKGNFWEDVAPATTYLRPVGDALVDKTVEKIKGSGMRKAGRKSPHGLHGMGLFSNLKKGAAKALNLAQTNPIVGAVATQLLDQIPTAAKALGTYAGSEQLGSLAGHALRQGIKAKTGLGLKKRKPRKKKGGALMVAGLR
jgi:hypothetical protein